MKGRSKVGFLSFLACVAFGVTSAADGTHTVVADVNAVTPMNLIPPGGGVFVVGFDFTVGPQSLLVSELGVFDFNGDGLAASHSVALWDLNTNVLAFVTVPAGTNALLLNEYRFAQMTNTVLLSSGTKYVLGALYVGYADAYVNESRLGIGFDQAVISGSGRFAASSPFFPASPGITGPPDPNANAMFTIVPEPKIPALLLVYAIALFDVRKTRAPNCCVNVARLR